MKNFFFPKLQLGSPETSLGYAIGYNSIRCYIQLNSKLVYSLIVYSSIQSPVYLIILFACVHIYYMRACLCSPACWCVNVCCPDRSYSGCLDTTESSSNSSFCLVGKTSRQMNFRMIPLAEHASLTSSSARPCIERQAYISLIFMDPHREFIIYDYLLYYHAYRGRYIVSSLRLSIERNNYYLLCMATCGVRHYLLIMTLHPEEYNFVLHIDFFFP